VVGLRIETAMI